MHTYSTTQKLLCLQDTHKLSHKYICHLAILQKIDWHLLSTLEPDWLHFVAVWYGLRHAYFKISLPSRQFHTDTKSVAPFLSFSLCEFIDSFVVILGLKFNFWM